MLYKKIKDEALDIRERAAEKYNATVEKLNTAESELYQSRIASKELIDKIEKLVNSIANTPKEFKATVSKIEVAVKKFDDTEKYVEESFKNLKKAGENMIAGVTAGTAVASLAPNALMWVATTFGKASTGKAISALSGAAAQKAALAWLGRGALSAGGAGIAGGQALLSLAGPIGWGITGVSAVASVSSLGIKNKKEADKAIEEAKSITMTGAELNETTAVIDNLKKQTDLLSGELSGQYEDCSDLTGSDYASISKEKQIILGAMVNSTLALAELLNKTVGEDDAG